MPLTYFRPRGDIKSNWELANPILKLREMGIEWETTVGVGKAKIKFGDGVTAWNNLNYAVNVASQIQSDTKSNWTSNNPVLGKDEMGIEWETTVGVGEFNIKVGDGTTAWNDLAYGLTSDITNKAIKTITEYSGDDENPALADGDTLSVAAGKLNEQQTFLKNTLGYERLATMAETLGGLSNEDFMGVMEKLNSIKFNKTDVYNGTDSTSTSLAASANALKTVKDLTDTNTTAISQLNSDLNNRNDVTDLLAEADVGINSKRIVNCGANTLNTPFKAGLTNAAQGTAYINMANENYGTVIYVANSGYEIFLRKKGSGVWDPNWYKLLTNADLPNVFTGTNLVTLNSPSQLTAPGFYYAEFMSNDVNANSGSNPMSDYSTGDFHMLLLAANANSTSGCRYGTLLVTSPRLTSSLWIGRIWDYQFTYWAKK